MATQKFRPVLTAEQIDYLIRMIREDQSEIESHENMNQSILRVLVPFQAKISIGAVTPSYQISPESERKRIDLETRARYNDGLMTPEEEAEYEAKILGV